MLQLLCGAFGSSFKLQASPFRDRGWGGIGALGVCVVGFHSCSLLKPGNTDHKDERTQRSGSHMFGA